MIRKLGFLFGAGAEKSFGISSGDDFAERLLALSKPSDKDEEPRDEIDSLIGEYYGKTLEDCKNKEWYPNFHHYSFGEVSLLENSIKKQWLSDFSGQTQTRKDFLDKVNTEAEKYQYKEHAEDGKQKTRVNSEGLSLIKNNPNYMGVLDENFHTIISPNALGPYKFWRVIKTYTRAYLIICEELLKNSGAEMRDFLYDPCTIQTKVRDLTKSSTNLQKESYYKLVRQLGKDVNRGIITTNYTPLCELAVETKEETPIAYIHGRLSWFECPYTLQVYDLLDEKEKKESEGYLLFPYIFIQSGIKPIVERKQLGEYAKMLQILDEADVLFIVGYRINGDDNHVNSLLHSYLKGEEKTLVYLDFDDKIGKDKLLQRLRIDSESSNLHVFPVDQHNCFTKFEELLLQYGS